VELTLACRTDGPLVRVTDTGPGIPTGEREAVLLRFYRADHSRHTHGTGLGLALVAAIVRLHEFTLTFADAERVGCRVEISASNKRKSAIPIASGRTVVEARALLREATSITTGKPAYCSGHSTVPQNPARWPL
jgi:hypothetical protein